MALGSRWCCDSCLALALAKWHPATLRSIFDWLQTGIRKVGGWFHRPHLVSDDWARKNSNDFEDGAKAIAEHPVQLSKAIIWGGFLHIINLVG